VGPWHRLLTLDQVWALEEAWERAPAQAPQ